MKHQIVIGAGYGDEGKGRMIDYFANITPNRKLIVRFNGGSQAGHNVVLPDGRSHIHSHLASGSLSNHDTFLSKFFVCNPVAFLNEWETLDTHFKVFVDPFAKVTSPYDIFINQGLERKRGKDRHGSVGVGFGETIYRYETYGSIPILGQTISGIRFYLESVRDKWFKQRCAHLEIPLEKDDPILHDNTINNWLEAYESFYYKIQIAHLPYLEEKYEQVLFEGAQGLMLDMDYGAFPHVTRSNTGLKNAVHLINGMNEKMFDVCYVTRSYVTRHGAGPLANENRDLPGLHLNTEKETNVTGEFQEHFRYATLDKKILMDAIKTDLLYYNPVKIQLAITCMDHWYQMPKLDHTDFDYVRNLGAEELYLGYGPSRDLTTKWNI